jgi:hypothetical protein
MYGFNCFIYFWISNLRTTKQDYLFITIDTDNIFCKIYLDLQRVYCFLNLVVGRTILWYSRLKILRGL